MTADEFAVVDTRQVFSGHAFDVRVDKVKMPDGKVADRDIIAHLGAVGVLALDSDDNVTIVRQYRPAVRQYLLELPAGLLDVAGEPALETAKRELYEEAGLTAGDWQVLIDLHTSPGMSDESIRIYLARRLSAVPAAERFTAEHEESTMTVGSYPLDELVGMALAGALTNGPAVAAVLAAHAARGSGWSGLRPVTAPWPARPDRVPDAD
ncbi:MAG: NUDIX domain-containing protein [Jatrophihabitantaceae bacterium]